MVIRKLVSNVENSHSQHDSMFITIHAQSGYGVDVYVGAVNVPMSVSDDDVHG